MSFSFISWKNAEKKSTSQRKLQNNRKKTFNRNILKQCSSKDTKTSYQRPHFSSKKEENNFKKGAFFFNNNTEGALATLKMFSFAFAI